MKRRVAEMESEAAKLREMHEQAAKNEQPSSTEGSVDAMETKEDRQAADERSVHVGNVSSVIPHTFTCGSNSSVLQG